MRRRLFCEVRQGSRQGQRYYVQRTPRLFWFYDNRALLSKNYIKNRDLVEITKKAHAYCAFSKSFLRPISLTAIGDFASRPPR